MEHINSFYRDSIKSYWPAFINIITAKDAVKFDTVSLDNVWVLEVEAELSTGLVDNILDAVNLG